MLEYIYASKLYKGSNNKAHIRAVAESPLNAELVQQLTSYLDPEYQEAAQRTELREEAADTKQESETVVKPSGSQHRAPSGPSFHPASDTFMNLPGEDLTVDEDIPEDESTDIVEPGEDAEVEPVEDIEVEEIEVPSASNVDGQPITASECVCISNIDAIVNDAEVIRGSLNNRQETAGVVRINVVDNELWIYYNDKINLNNIMEPVISTLTSSGYAFLSFNRLARTDNAIVFQIDEVPVAADSIKEADNGE